MAISEDVCPQLFVLAHAPGGTWGLNGTDNGFELASTELQI
jgi:hypothetical protein